MASMPRLGPALTPSLAMILALLLAVGCAGKRNKVEIQMPDKPLAHIPIQVPWAVENTVKINNIYGYDIMRSDSSAGEFIKVNDDLIVPSPDDPTPQFVTYNDRGLTPGATYYYFLVAVLQNGTKAKATPVTPTRATQEMTLEDTRAWLIEQAEKKAESQEAEAKTEAGKKPEVTTKESPKKATPRAENSPAEKK